MATTNPIRFSEMNTTLRLAAMISAEISLLLKDTGNLRNSPHISFLGDITGTGSDTLRIRRAGLDGYDNMESPANEVAALTAQALSVFKTDVTAARIGLMYQISDLATMTGFGGSDVDPFRLALSMSGSYEKKFASLTAAAASAGFTGTPKGSNVSQFSVDDWFSGIYALEMAGSSQAGVAGGYFAVLMSKAITELQDSLRNETSNAVSIANQTQEMLRAKGQNFMGTLFGVDLYKSSLVTANGSSGYDNFMAGSGALGYISGAPILAGASEVVQAGPVAVEFERTGAEALTSVIGHAYLGVAVVDADKGILINSAQ